MARRVQVSVRGIVQGVGFRPHVARLAGLHRLTGHVLNSSDGVHLVVEGEASSVDQFLKSLIDGAPNLARIESVRITELDPCGEAGFAIRESRNRDDEFIPVAPDAATCPDCLSELDEPRDRRFRYPFINCTKCGPRFTIIREIPYDRALTTMSAFEMCAQCRAEYENIADRRYHAQPTACPKCGPTAWLEVGGAIAAKASAGAPSIALSVAAGLLREGKIGAVKGLGGFHIACDATNEEAVRRLRALKGREERPLALMTSCLEEARRFVHVSKAERAWLERPERPIVLLARRGSSPIAASVAPGNRFLGVMLPYTPMHWILVRESGLLALVMTSGNLTEEPLCTENQEARERLSGLVDFFVHHDRGIHTGCDDSVMRVFEEKPLLIRRSRGFAPAPISLAFPLREVVGVGAELKGSFCLTRDHYCFLSQHIGDLKNWETLRYFEKSLGRMKRLLRVSPEAVAHDFHPDYLSTRIASEWPIERRIPVQHHHAHVAACMAEHGILGPAIGLAADGIGLGTDGTLWGCEFLRIDTIAAFDRKAHLVPVPMPGGDQATREPWRMAAAYLYQALGEGWTRRAIPFCRGILDEDWQTVRQMIDKGVNSPLCSSAGRLFDAVAALVGLRARVTYEGQAAVELEQLAETGTRLPPYRFEVKGRGPRLIDLAPMFREVVDDLERQVAPSVVSRRFHETCAAFMAEECRRIAEESGIHTVCVGGGTFQNVMLLALLKERLRDLGLLLYWPQTVPPNDGGIALGQAVVASAILDS